nr:DUF1298 domain-containing protein [Mycolicibacterium mengxianglii]
MARLAATDAQAFWMSGKIANDDFLLYAFDGAPPLRPALAQLHRRAAVCHDLRLRILDDCPARYPAWVYGALEPSQFMVHDGLDWPACMAAVADLADDQLDATTAAWRVHVFTPVTEVPSSSGPATVAVLQLSHALADGTRSADLAGWLFGRATPVKAVTAPRPGSLVLRSVTAARAHQQLVRDTAAGVLPVPAAPSPPLLTNSMPAGARTVRTLLRRRASLGDRTVTVSVLTAISTALAGYLRDRGEEVSGLAAEVPMAYSGVRHAHNHFRNIGVALHPDLPVAGRAEVIAAQLSAGRARSEHPAALAERRSFAAVPAPLLRWGLRHFDTSTRPPAVTGHTVVTSVYRGAADLHFGDAPVLFTAGYPALSPMMGLVHGVHGIGDAVAISVHGTESAGDVDDYVARLARALG